MASQQANQWVKQIAEQPIDIPSLGLAEQDSVMLRYAMKLTQNPAAMVEDDVLQLRQVGFDDCAIHDICNVTAYFAYVNRVADGLGVALETE